jgi:hypothetical protein
MDDLVAALRGMLRGERVLPAAMRAAGQAGVHIDEVQAAQIAGEVWAPRSSPSRKATTASSAAAPASSRTTRQWCYLVARAQESTI